MNLDEGIIMKSEMKKDTTYLLCPDSSCKLYSDLTKDYCEYECPLKSELVKIILCNNCREPIELPGDHNQICRVDHNCPDGRHASNFQRMSGKSRIIYEQPK
jgi:hypothetical protein